MDNVSKLRHQRAWVLIAAGIGIGAAMGASYAFTSMFRPGEPAPLGLYLVYWMLAMMAGGGVVWLGYAQAIRAATHLRYFADISSLAESRSDADALISRLSEIAGELYGLDVIAYRLYDEAGNLGLLRLLTGVELPREYQDAVEGLMQKAGDEALDSNSPVLRRIDETSQVQQRVLAALQASSFLLLPLTWGNTLVAMVCSTGKSSHGLAKNDCQSLVALGQEVARSLHADLLLQGRDELQQEASVYGEVVSATASQIYLDRVLLSVLRWAGSRLEADGAGVMLVDSETGNIKVTAGEGLLEGWSRKETSEVRESPILAQAFVKRGEPLRVNSIQSTTSGALVNKEAAKRLGINSIVAAPLIAQGGVLGIVIAIRSSPESAFAEDDERRLTAIANRAAAGVATALLYNEERGRIAQLDQIAISKSNLIYNISHELRTSLASLKAATDLLVEEEGIEPGSDYFDRLMQSISRNVARLEALVSNIVDMASLDSQGISLNLERIDVRDFVAETTSIVGPLINKKGQVLSLSAPTGLPRLVADRQRLSQVLVNLLSNAHKYAPEGSEISLSVEKHGDRLTFVVGDSGPGISPEERERVFEAFYRVQKSSDAGVPGSGLGLAIAKSLVELHKGAIWSEDNPVGGTLFMVSLPIEGINESPAN